MNELRGQVAQRIYKSDGFNQAEYDADELITLIRTATLDEVKEAIKSDEDILINRKHTRVLRIIDKLRGTE